MSHDHDHGTSSESMASGMMSSSDSSTAAAAVDHSDHDHDHFCTGDGTVMLNGFQAATQASVSCVLFLFENAAVDTKTKYVFAIMGAFLMGFANELIRYTRGLMAKGAFPSLPSGTSLGADVVKAAGFAVQIFVAYMLMLLVMLYEYVFLIAVILGLSAGHLLTLRLAFWRRQALLEAGQKTPPEVAGVDAPGSSGTPCCDNATCSL